MDNDLDFLLKKIKKPISLERIVAKVQKVSDYSAEDIKKYLDSKLDSFEIIRTKNGNYVPIRRTSFRVGYYKEFRNGDGIVMVDNDTNYYISCENAENIVDGDFVMIDTYIPAGNKEKSSRVVEILNRDLTRVVGEVIKIGDSYFVEADDRNKKKLTIALEGTDYILGEKVIVDLDDQRSSNFYVGKIIKSIGHKDDPGVDILMEAYRYGIDPEISVDAKNELMNIPDKVLDSDLVNRMDLRDKEIFTIDGISTKDIDDAISLEILENGNYLLGVHIADVTNYVKFGSHLYNSAKEKATSSYLADTVIPMLPHKLSNGICSLNPNVDRLAISCMMEINDQGEIVNYNLWESVINSKKQMNYDAVNDILERNYIREDYKKYASTLLKMYKLSIILKKKRENRGAIEFNRSELKLIMNDKKEVEGFSIRKQNAGESLIEEFMLIANETVATHMSSYPFIYRIHDTPNEEKLEELLNLLDFLNYDFTKNNSNGDIVQSLAKYLDNCGSLSEMLKVQLLRTFSKAKYSTENIGHYGLASSYYCHFTSPIRRFPDTTVHQLLKDFVFHNDNQFLAEKIWEEELPKIAEHSSYKERQADECEKMVLLMKCAEYMEKHIGDKYIGTVISMDNDGIYIELDNMVTGKVKLKDLKGKYFYNPETLSFISYGEEDDYSLGDRLELEVCYASKMRKEINFKIISKVSENERIDKKTNQFVKKKKKEEKYLQMYYNVNKGRK